MTLTLWRAGKDADVTRGTCFATERSAAEAYLDNGGFGGPILYCATVTPSRVLTIEGGQVRDALRALDAIGVDTTGAELRAETLAQVLDQDDVLEALAALGYDWVVYEDDYPEDCTTWRVVSDAAMWAAGDAIEAV